MSKVKINKADKHRILLTELLPYEAPMLFSNDGLYSLIVSGKLNHYFARIKNLSRATSDKEGRKYGIPFNYEVRKSVQGDTRILSVIHPLNQLEFIPFYEKYDSLILHLCSKSPFSLRRVTKIAKYYYSPDLVFEEDELKNTEVEVEPDVLDNETKLLKSYFTYHPIDLIYKFYERNEYQRLEQRFNYLMEFDISKCFYNIYTHSICWAVKNKETSKRNSRTISFENSFDKLMQLSNYNETNGIVVGPEVSRIFAEIILQQIDINVLNKLNEKKLEIGIDYEIRRYVDDFFVFSNDKENLSTILAIYKKELEEYKLYTNPLKTEIRTTPFISNIAVGKRELKHLLDDLIDKLIEKDDHKLEDGNIEKKRTLLKLSNPYNESQNFIKDFQCIVRRNNLTYDILSKEIIRALKRTTVKIFKDSKLEKDKDSIEGFLFLVLDISFYSYSLNITSSTTFKLSQMIVLICKFLAKQDENLKHTIFSKIFRESDFVINIFQRKVRPNETNVETLNLLIALKKLDKGYLFSEKRIRKLFGLQSWTEINRLNYFHIITLLYYIENFSDYSQLKIDIEKSVIQRYIDDTDPFSKAELTLLFFDFICCPFVSDKSKKRVILESKFATDTKEQENIIKEIVTQRVWFMDWDVEIDLERVLKKKEWGASY